MHYNVDGCIIESDLAAKSTSQTNKNMLNIILDLPECYTVLDYGCGKLRYSIPLAKRVREVVAVDSVVQLDKKQLIDGEYTSVREYKLDNLAVYDLDADEWKCKKYDAVLCINVFSAVPSLEERKRIVENAYSVLEPDGFFLIVVQYRNSYFSQYKSRPNAINYYDGWLIKRKGNKYSFYGMPSEKAVIALCSEVGFKSFSVTRNDGSYYIKAFRK